MQAVVMLALWSLIALFGLMVVVVMYVDLVRAALLRRRIQRSFNRVVEAYTAIAESALAAASAFREFAEQITMRRFESTGGEQ